MKDSERLNGAAVLAAGGSLLTTASRTNWAGSYTYIAAQLEAPASLDELRAIIRSQARVKALGARHSFNDIGDTDGVQVSLEHFDDMELNADARRVTVGGGVSYGRLAPFLQARGFAVHNLASLPHIGVVGACSTATHGSGSGNGNLSSAVRAMEVVTADGELRSFSRETLGADFDGTVVGLGAVGVVTRITLEIEPSFAIAQSLYHDLPFAVLEHRLEEVFASAYSISLFTDWQRGRASQVWIKRRVGRDEDSDGASFYGASPATRKLHPLAGYSAENCTEQMGVPGPWHERLPHFRMEFTPSSGAEIQTEYFVPLDRGYEAIRAVEALRDRVTPLLLVSEFRTIAADELWLSPCYRRQSLALHFTWEPHWDEVRKVLPMIEEALAPFDARPHWGKTFTMAPETVQSRYPKMRDFLALVGRYDPEGRFRNAFLERNLYTAGT